MAEAEQREIAETLFGRTREEIRDAIKLEDERRVKHLPLARRQLETNLGDRVIDGT